MEKCLCEGKGWIRMPNTKAIIFCPDCEKPLILKKNIKIGTKVVSPVFGTGEVIITSGKKQQNITVKFVKYDDEFVLDKNDISYIYDQS